MKKTEAKNLPVSIHDRLLRQARQEGRPLNELLQYYAIERFLYRLVQSRYANLFVLKGALLFRLWRLSPLRPTRDIDLLGYTENDLEKLIAIVKEICDLKVSDDGVRFDTASVTGERIREEAEYEGMRIRFQGLLGKMRLHLQIDIAFGDVVSPSTVRRTYPTLLSMPGLDVRSYPPETVIAEKLQIMVHLGSANSRMKDFYDVWLLTDQFDFKGKVLQEAIRQTFQNRATAIPEDEPIAFSERFAQEKQRQWTAFLKTDAVAQAPDQLILATNRIRDFVQPIFDAILGVKGLHRNWSAKQGWK